MKLFTSILGALFLISLSLLAFEASAQDLAQDIALASHDSGDTAWILTSTALVLFMTIPGLALFYGGLVRSQSVLSVLMHCFVICCMASVLWLVGVYSLAFSDGGDLQGFIGGLDKMALIGVGKDALSGNIPESVFFMFQMTFAIITPALIVGAYVERIRFSAMLIFSALWLVFVYAPVCHWVWGGGWLGQMGVLDFAGGLVVHVTAGTAAIVIALMMRTRRGFPGHVKPPHSPGMTMTGAAMLWVGWFGFNAGSALAADGSAGMAMLVTHISAATASLVWMAIEWAKYGKPSLIGTVTGTIAGLATITPAAGFVGPLGGLIIGTVSAIICFYAVVLVKSRLKIDDSLDVMAVHGVGGATGIILVSVLATESFGGFGLAEGMTITSQLSVQIIAIVATLIWTAVISCIILKVAEKMVGSLSVNEDEEVEGLDIMVHGEKAYEI
ncbi:MAG: ammonium transporter [Rhodospirillaceae bacterium]|jgi:ammonium transporter, Amt family|nr:ammonium transporter [Rhodospirillaceae bacterium]MBT5374372.1 ammonium transporter [Rhodospirillaceae bacterium]MBT5751707.1 ammonium transporter [Rhodospirillaceae bacterium]